jgi:serine/threonine protein phosphatase PrpC
MRKSYPTPDKPVLLLEQDLDKPQFFQLAGYQVGIFTRRSPDKESPNEDAAAIIPCNNHAFVVAIADGAGGQRGGGQASALAIQHLAREVERAVADRAEWRGAILNGIETANAAIQSLGIGAYTTLVVAEIQGHTVRPYHIGDSEILLTGSRGKIKLQVLPHSPVAYAVEAGYLNEAEALQHEERHIVSNLLGADDMRIDIGSAVNMSVQDTLIIGSDGLYDNLAMAELIELARKGRLDRSFRRIIELCDQRMSSIDADQPGKPDDLSILMLRRGSVYS